MAGDWGAVASCSRSSDSSGASASAGGSSGVTTSSKSTGGVLCRGCGWMTGPVSSSLLSRSSMTCLATFLLIRMGCEDESRSPRVARPEPFGLLEVSWVRMRERVGVEREELATAERSCRAGEGSGASGCWRRKPDLREVPCRRNGMSCLVPSGSAERYDAIAPRGSRHVCLCEVDGRPGCE